MTKQLRYLGSRYLRLVTCVLLPGPCYLRPATWALLPASPEGMSKYSCSMPENVVWDSISVDEQEYLLIPQDAGVSGT